MKSREGTTVGVFRIGAIAERYGIHPQTLRMYEREGLLRPARTEGNTRLYDNDTIERLEMRQAERMEKMQGEVKKVLQAMQEEAETRRPGTDRTLALARIPGRRYADPRSDKR